MRYKNEYRRSVEEYKPMLPIRRKIGLYWILAALRFLLVFLQTGYIHPDECFQSIEVISGDQFDIDVNRPWEFNATFPIRSVFMSQLTVGIPYFILKRLLPFAFHIFRIHLTSPYYLILFPRLFMCLLSFITDYCLYKICCLYGQNYKIRLITLASSYVTLIYATRTFSNSIELILTSLLLYYTSECMVYTEKVVIQSDRLLDRYDKAKTGVERTKCYKLLASLPSHSLHHCFKMATITVVGIFNRPTFVAFALAPIFFWLQRGLGSRSVGFRDFHVRIFTFVLYSIPVVIFFILVDSMYFSYLTTAEILNWEISMNNFVVTPLNFLKYNVNVNNLKNHGLHPRFLHFFINVPLLFNIIGLIGLFTFGKMVYSGLRGHWLQLPRIQSIVGLMMASFILPIALLSVFPHQEPRFIIPVILPLVFLYAPNLNNISGADAAVQVVGDNIQMSAKDNKLKKLQLLWLICNLLLTVFYGFAHQGGVISLTSRIATELKAKPHLTHIHLYTSYTYSIPTALLHLRNTQRTYVSSSNHKYRLTKDFFLYEQGSRDMKEVYDRISLKLKECDEKYRQQRIPYRIYYAFPVSAFNEFKQYSLLSSSNFLKYRAVTVFYPHISMERLSVSDLIIDINIWDRDISATRFLHEITSCFVEYVKQFGLLLVSIEHSALNETVKYRSNKMI